MWSSYPETGGLVIGIGLTGCGRKAADLARAPVVPVDLNAWLQVGTDGVVRFYCDRSEMGQGVYTALPMLIAEELGVATTAIRVEFAPAGEQFTNQLLGTQITGGSTSVCDAWVKLRTAGAQAREMLITPACAQWGIATDGCRTEAGEVILPMGERLPLLAHATLEPQNCTASVTAEGCDIYVPTQIQIVAQGTAAAAAGLKPEQVHVRTTPTGRRPSTRYRRCWVPMANPWRGICI